MAHCQSFRPDRRCLSCITDRQQGYPQGQPTILCRPHLGALTAFPDRAGGQIPNQERGPPKRRALMSLLLFISSFFCFCLLLRPQLPLLLGFTFYLLDLPFLFSRGETGRFISAAFLLCFVSSSWSPPLQLHPVCYSCLHFITT